MSNADLPPAPPPPPAPEPSQPAGPAEPRNRLPVRSKIDRYRPKAPEGKPPPLDAEQSTRGPKIRELDSQIEQELQAALSGLSEKDIFGDEPKNRPAAAGGVPGRKKGRVISIHGADVFVEVPGGRSQGVLPMMQFEEGPPAIGTEVEVDIEGYDAANGLLKLTRKGAAQQVDWSSVAVGMIVEARVTEVNKGGLAVEVNGIRGFMPMGQIDLYRVEQPEQFVNQRLRALVTEVNPEDRNLVVSRRDLMEQEREAAREKLWAELAEGQTRTGTVRAIKPFGVFVDLGGADGLVPMSELSWARVEDAAQLVQLGQKVQVLIMRIDPQTRKIGLSLRQLQASPWDTLPTRLFSGSRVSGKVTRVADFGAFVEIEPGVEGLIHISELSPQRIRRVRDVVQEGQTVEVMVLSIDTEQRRISLSLKAAQAQPAVEEAPEPEADDDAPAPEVKPQRPRNYTLRGGVGE